MEEIKNRTVPVRLSARILTQEEISTQIFSMWLEAPSIVKNARPGQFVSVYSNDSGRLLPRPLSICETDLRQGALRFVYRIAGNGTREFSECRPGDTLDLLGPLGNGFPKERTPAGKKAFLIGGGIGIPPMVQLAKELPGEAQIIAGYRDKLFLTDELASCGRLYLATEDGSCGTKGNVLDAVRANALTADVIYACGPMPMLRAVKTYAKEQGIECWLSLEERMACGIGACLGCVCRSTGIDEHSRVHNKRICREGPVFLADEVEL